MRSSRRKPSHQELATLAHLFKQGCTTEAEVLSKSLTTRFPKHGFGWKVLGVIYQAQKRYDEALYATRQAIDLLPDDAAPYNNLGTTLLSLKRIHDAEAQVRKALAIAPNYVKALCNLGSLLVLQEKCQEAEDYCRRALAIDPFYTKAHISLGNALAFQNRDAEAQASYRVALKLKPDRDDVYTHLLHLLTLDVTVEPQHLYNEHRSFGEQFEAPLRASWQIHTNDKDPTRELKIGFVSGDFYDHAVIGFLEPAFKILAQKQTLSLHAYYTNTNKDQFTNRLHTYFAHWHDVAHLDAVELAGKIRADGIDILFDLSGHTVHNRLLTFAYKPAPIQVSWLGYLGTTGLQAMDYYLCDRFWIPPDELAWQFTEKLAFLPTAAIFQPSEEDAPPINALPALKNSHITFGSFNRPNKFNPAIIALWSMLLRDIPNARMALGAIPLESQAALIQSFSNEGIAQSRLTFYPRSNTPDYLALHHQVDLCLDTFPHGGGATTAHAIWMGVPTLSLAGETPASRFGATVMHHLGLDSFIATSIEDYVAKGCYWANHMEELANLRATMRTRFEASPLGQPQLFADNFEALMRTMWQRWCDGLPAVHVEVDIPFEVNNGSEPATQSRSGPTDHDAQLKMANWLCQQGRLDEAVKNYLLALSMQPNHAETYSRLGDILRQLGYLKEAESYCRQAIALQPDLASSHNYLGIALHAQSKFSQAKISYQQALVLKPDWADAYNNLAYTLQAQGYLDEAEDCYQKLLTLAPNLAAAMDIHRLHLLTLDVTVEAQHLFAQHVAFGEQFEAPLRVDWQAHNNSKEPMRCLQVGFVSGDLNAHALTSFLEPVFKKLAQKQGLSLHAYCTQMRGDEVNQRLHTYFAHWHDVANLSEPQLANKIRADGIDILFDLSGHTTQNRLLTFARKPAPIQVSWLGYLGTTGLQAMDYYLCDRYWIPPGELDWQFTEKLALLPTAVVFEPTENTPLIGPLPALEKGYVTFGSFNRLNKINPSVMTLWSMLLCSIPTARMVLANIPEERQEALIQSFSQEGVAPSRLTFYPRSNMPDYLALHHQVDFCLDTFPHSGGATTAYAAWMGVPTLSLAGETPASRFGATEMHHLGLDSFIATSIEDYVEKGCYWASHVEELAALRAQMRARFEASPLGQTQNFADNFETLLRTMWQRWCNDLPVTTFEIEVAKVEPTDQVEPGAQELATLADLSRQKNYPEAQALAQLLVSRFPEHGFAWKILGAVLHSSGKLDEALLIKKKTVELRPDDDEAHFNLACEFDQQGYLEEAVESYFSSLRIKPDQAAAYNNAGTILKTFGLFADAEIYFRQAIALDTNMASAHNNLGATLHAQGHYAQAQTSYRLALVLKPDWAEAYNNLAITLKDQGDWSEAEACYRKALALKPSWAAAHSNFLYCLSHDVQIEAQQLLAEHVAFGEQFEPALRADWQAHHNVKDSARCLQIGFVSGDLNDHALTSFLEPAFKGLAQKQTLSLHAYDTNTNKDQATQRLQTYFAHWHDVANLSEAELADKIRADGIDILFDLSGHTARNRLLTFARKPAPIQVSWLGYLGTTGLQAMDYYLCDPYWIPPGELDWQFTEKLAYLPTAVIFQPYEQAPTVNSLPALENSYVTFGSFNRINKLNASVIILWSMLLRSIPTARMVLGAIPVDSQAALIQSFAQEGIEQNRLTFYPRTKTPDYLALHHQIDICLDTFPFGGGATTAHAAWMGIPTLSLAGETPASRLGATEMHHLGLDEFIANSIEDYVEKGCYWAAHLDELATVRANMRALLMASPLGQHETFVDNFETLLRTLWQRWCNDLPTLPGIKNSKISIEIISATKLSESNFWSTSALGQSLQRHLERDDRLSFNIAFENSRGLPEIFNYAIDQAPDDAILVFIHDDVWINELNFSDAIIAGLEIFDVIGVAGNRRRLINQPAWCFLDSNFTWDSKYNLSGRVSHGEKSLGHVLEFGATPAECELLDGVFLAVKKNNLISNHIRFDDQFHFHFYDMDFCRSAKKSGLRLGTWLINLTHQSVGAFGTPQWQEKYQAYLNKWEATFIKNNILSEKYQKLQKEINLVLEIALKNQVDGLFEQAEHIYLEVLKIQPRHAEANHNLGLLEINSKGIFFALPRLEIAVLEKPENEKFWISYINSLMNSGSENIVKNALQLGLQHGLRVETAIKLSELFLITKT